MPTFHWKIFLNFPLLIPTQPHFWLTASFYREMIVYNIPKNDPCSLCTASAVFISLDTPARASKEVLWLSVSPFPTHATLYGHVSLNKAWASKGRVVHHLCCLIFHCLKYPTYVNLLSCYCALKNSSNSSPIPIHKVSIIQVNSTFSRPVP